MQQRSDWRSSTLLRHSFISEQVCLVFAASSFSERARGSIDNAFFNVSTFPHVC